ncbi:ABC transporter permease [uncultured Maritimibacter sp.]|jgi:capsular polysaccharide transport system permease protein|uniref:ABC transporter permease n=1 Tax=uncultured Maritimibacter sp. TaxID=991866 RepID=UPI00261E669B|nr:ABC transporter permease [uncultured Maritimibacter sp.]
MFQTLVIQARVIVALTLRETRMAFGTSFIGYLLPIFQPIFGVGFLVFLFYLIGRHPPFGESLALFFATGVLTLDVYNKSSSSLMKAFTTNKALLSYPMINFVDTLLARLTLIGATYAVVFVVFFSGLMLLDMATMPAHPERVIIAFMATLFLGFGKGSLDAVLYQMFPSWQNVDKVLSRPMYFLSGIFYVPGLLPPEAVAVLKWNPVLHCVEWARTGWYQNYPDDVFNPWYPLAFASILLLIGLFSERITRKQRGGMA